MAHLFSEALRVRLAVLVMVLAPIVLSGHSHAMDRAAPASLGFLHLFLHKAQMQRTF